MECSCHGFQFGEKGKCVVFPSNNVTPPLSAPYKMTHEELGLVWVWAGPNHLAHLDLIPRLLFAPSLDTMQYGEHLCDDTSHHLALPYDLVLDNLLDYAHIHFTHDGLFSSRKYATWTTATEIEESSYKQWNRYAKSYHIFLPGGNPMRGGQVSKDPISTFIFVPPCFSLLEHDFGNGKKYVQVFINIPSTPNRMKLMTRFYRNFYNPYLLEYIPGTQWISEKVVQTFVGQDLEMLSGVRRNIVEHGAPVLGSIVSADMPIKGFRDFQFAAIKKYKTIYSVK